MTAAPDTHRAAADVRDELALEAYGDRLERCRRRLVDELEEARLRLRWRQHEHAARAALDADQVRALTEVGVFVPVDDQLDERRIIHRRRAQLDAIAALERFTIAAVDGLRTPENRSGEQEG